jgi:hypothetical protein
MPRSVDLFISSPDPLEAVSQAIAEATGFGVEPASDGSWVVRDREVDAVLSEHGRPDDGELPLSRYPYVLSGTVEDAVRPQDSAPAALLRQVAQKLQEKSGLMMLMVLDLQYREAPGRRHGAPSPEVPA